MRGSSSRGSTWGTRRTSRLATTTGGQLDLSPFLPSKNNNILDRLSVLGVVSCSIWPPLASVGRAIREGTFELTFWARSGFAQNLNLLAYTRNRRCLWLVAHETALQWLSKDDNENFLHYDRDQLWLCCPAYVTSGINKVLSCMAIPNWQYAQMLRATSAANRLSWAKTIKMKLMAYIFVKINACIKSTLMWKDKLHFVSLLQKKHTK